MFIVELVRPGVAQPRVPWWIARAAAFNAAQVATVWLAAMTWDRWLPQWRLLDGDRLGPVAGVMIGYLATTFVFYWWHRARHEVPVLWRWLHQIHHTPVRVEVAMAFYKHPLEMLVNGLVSSTLLHVVLGLSPGTTGIVVAITGVAELVYHWNVRTPYWLGWFFQRPEMHRRHHERDWHDSNYSDLPLWDLAFGTFDNPRETPQLCGFANEQELQLARMLQGKEPDGTRASRAARIS